MEVTENDWLYSLCLTEGVGRKTIFAIYQTSQSFSNWTTDTIERLRMVALPLSVRKQIASRMNLQQIMEDKRQRLKNKIQMVSFIDEHFPTALRHIPDPPAVLFYLGEYSLLSQPLIAIVGTRKATRYGESACQYFATSLSRAGITVVSGMALGIDTLAHRYALEAGAPTIAVLGCAIDQIYPKQNTRMYQQIERQGLIISEYPPDTKLHPGMFPERNRIISGISHGVLIIEAAERSGSLITAEHALEQGKEVFAVPGSIFSSVSTGPHNLIKMGAKPVTNYEDIIEEFRWAPIKVSAQTIFDNLSLDSDEQFLLSMISEAPIHWDELYLSLDPAKRTMLDTTLVQLQTKKCVEWLPGGYYRRRADSK